LTLNNDINTLELSGAVIDTDDSHPRYGLLEISHQSPSEGRKTKIKIIVYGKHREHLRTLSIGDRVFVKGLIGANRGGSFVAITDMVDESFIRKD